MTRTPVAVLGATGAVGQRLVSRLAGHPWFEIAVLAASDRSAGKTYGEAVRWILPEEPPPEVVSLPVRSTDPVDGVPIAFSALDASVAGEVEEAWAARGTLVSSNARNHRMDPDVPLLVPEVNPGHLALLDGQAGGRGWPERGALLTNPNCSTIGLVLALAPIHRAFGIRQVLVTTLQAASGAGYPGVPSLDLLGNVVPYIAGEEDKIESESQRILGRLEGERIAPAEMAISATATRVGVVDGHLASVSVALSGPASESDLRHALETFRGEPQERGLPTAPDRPLVLLDEPDRPQPARDAGRGDGMSVSVGRLRPCPVLDFKFALLSHNTVRGAAGAAILNVETLVSRRGERP